MPVDAGLRLSLKHGKSLKVGMRMLALYSQNPKFSLVAMPSEARKYSGDRSPDPQNRDMAVIGCGALACCEQDSDPPLTPGWARDSVDLQTEGSFRGSFGLGTGVSAGGRLVHDTNSLRYSRPDLVRVSPVAVVG